MDKGKKRMVEVEEGDVKAELEVKGKDERGTRAES